MKRTRRRNALTTTPTPRAGVDNSDPRPTVPRTRNRVPTYVFTADPSQRPTRGYRRVGFDTFIVELAAPYDDETMAALIETVKPMVEGASTPA
jgi:hypothetical protein